MSKYVISALLSLTILLPMTLTACGGEATPTPIFPTDETATATSTPTAPAAARTKAVVVRVVDGDTVELEGGQLVRYIGIDAPEFSPYKEDFFGREAYEHNKKLVEGKEVELESDVSDTDNYGRLLRYVFVGGLFVNAELVSQGYAKAKPSATDLKYQEMFQGLEREAKQAGMGLWSEQAAAATTEATEETATPEPEPAETPEETPTPEETEEATETPEEPTATPTITATETVTPTATPVEQTAGEVRIAALDTGRDVITLVNIGADPADLQGWSILSVSTGVQFALPSFILQPGAQVNIWTQGSGGGATDIYIGLGQTIWSGEGVRAELYSPAGILVDAY